MDNELIPIEVPSIVSGGDNPEAFAKLLESQAATGKRIQDAIVSMLVACTFPQDWTEQGGFMCLGSAGAERIGSRFNISYDSPDVEKTEFSDEHGPGYTYVFTGTATLRHGGTKKTCYTEGSFSTRDKFLGFANGKWRPLSEINESNIRRAAYHIWTGNAIKALLGIRKVPKVEYARIMAGAGRNPADSGAVNRGRGTQGGTTADDSPKQRELAETLIAFADAGKVVVRTETGLELQPISDSDSRENLELARASCHAISGEESAKMLKGTKLTSALAAAKELK